MAAAGAAVASQRRRRRSWEGRVRGGLSILAATVVVVAGPSAARLALQAADSVADSLHARREVGDGCEELCMHASILG